MSDGRRSLGAAAVAFLVVASLGVVGPPTDGGVAAASTSTATYAVEQGGDCVEVTPFAGEQSASAFYDYRSHATEPRGSTYSSHGTGAFQGHQESQLFLYRGPEGTSLVFLHDELGDEEGGGAVTFTITGLPPGREWVVEDDTYPNRDDNFDHGRTSSTIDWMWQANRSDGAAVRGLGDGAYDAVTIDPAFGEASRAYQEREWDWATDDITAWNVRVPDGSPGGTVATTLDKDAAVSIRQGPCGTPTPSPTPSPTATPSPSPTPSPTPTPTETNTRTPTETATPSNAAPGTTASDDAGTESSSSLGTSSDGFRLAASLALVLMALQGFMAVRRRR